MIKHLEGINLEEEEEEPYPVGFFCNMYLNLAGLSIKPRDLSILLALTALSTSLILIPLLLMMMILLCRGSS